MRVVFIHGACVRDGQWWWHRAAEELAGRGIGSVSPLLPSCGETGVAPDAAGPGLSDDVASVRRELEATDEPTVVVAHSYGGIVAAEAIDGLTSVHHLVLVASYLPEAGESLSSFGSDGPAPYLDVDATGGTFSVVPSLLAETFLQDCADSVREEALQHLAPQSLSVLQQPVRAAAWHHLPTTYVVCAADRGTAAEAQREFARRADTVVELDTGHHPFLSRPEAVADLIAAVRS